MKNQKNDEKLQEKYAESQILNEQVQQFQQKLNLIAQQVQQLKEINLNLGGFKKSKKDSEMMFSLGPGIYSMGILKDTDLLVNVGSNILVKKSIPDTIKIINEQIKELENALRETEQGYTGCIIRLQKLQNQIAGVSGSK